MMTIEGLKKRKKELGYTNAMIAEKSGVPLGTVQKIFSGATEHPRYDTLEALQKVLIPSFDRSKDWYRYDPGDDFFVRERAEEYYPFSELPKVPAKRAKYWVRPEPSEKWPRQGEYTVADIDALPDDVRVELIDGCIYDMATPSVTHQRVVGYLFTEFSRCISEHGDSCEVFMAPSAFYPGSDGKTELQPDIQVRCIKGNRTGEGSETVTSLVVEVLSPSTRYRDCTIKLRKYMCSEVREYWIIDINNKKVLVYLFDEDPLPTQYSFTDNIPVGISEGLCSIDFGSISKRLESASRIFGDEW